MIEALIIGVLTGAVRSATSVLFATLTTTELESTDYLVEGVIGTIPK